MNFKYFLIPRVLIVAVLVCALSGLQAKAQEQEVSLRVMSFNIRFGTAPDGENHWDKRKSNVVTTIADFAPDVLGTQETLRFQAAFLVKNLEGYTYVGRSRDQAPSGEQCGILVRSSRFDILEHGHFWLSESPNVPGSKSWDSSLPRMASWVKLYDRRSKTVFYVVNTHFDHRGLVARDRSAQVLVERTKRFEKGVPVIITGDFNTGVGTFPYTLLTDSFVDTYRHRHPGSKLTGTFSAFRGKTDGARIDFIFASPDIKILDAGIDRREFEGRNPSDHFPVTSVLQLKK